MSLDTALWLCTLGYSIVPVRDKIPIADKWQDIQWTHERIRRAFEVGRKNKKGKLVKANGVGLILREGLIDFDCDGPEAGAAFTKLGLPETVGWTSKRGNHYVYRLSEDARKEIAACGKKKWVLDGQLEVRTGTLQSVLPPSGGREWLDRSLLDHEPTVLDNLGFLPAPRDRPSDPGFDITGRPGDAYNEQADWEDILMPLGCRLVGTRTSESGQPIRDWLRPGDTDQPLSMTTGYCESGSGEPRLYVFTTNFPPFESGQSYSKFEAYCLIHHDGDHTAAARALAGEGYSRSVDAREIFGPAQAEPKEPAPEPISLSSLAFPGVVETVRDWHTRRSQVVDPAMGTVAGLVLVSWMIGRQVRLEDGTRPNISVLVTGEPGSGKSEVRDTLSAALSGAGYSACVARDIVSGPALEESLLTHPNLLLLRDEVQDLFLKANQNQYTMTLMSRLKEAFSSSKQSFGIRKKATEKSDEVIHQPNLVPLLLGTPAVVNNIPHGFYEDGFMARLLHFEVDERAPRNHDVRDLEPPDELIETIRQWQDTTSSVFKDADEFDDTQAREAVPVPRVVPCTAGAWDRLREITDEWQVKGYGVERQLYRRGQELVCKLCLIGAMSESPDREIDRTLVERMIDQVDRILANKLYRWEQRGYGDGEHEQMVSRIARYVGQRGKIGWALPMKNLKIPAKKYYEILIDLVNRGLIDSDAKMSPDGSRFLKIGTYLEAPDHESDN